MSIAVKHESHAWHTAVPHRPYHCNIGELVESISVINECDTLALLSLLLFIQLLLFQRLLREETIGSGLEVTSYVLFFIQLVFNSLLSPLFILWYCCQSPFSLSLSLISHFLASSCRICTWSFVSTLSRFYSPVSPLPNKSLSLTACIAPYIPSLRT